MSTLYAYIICEFSTEVVPSLSKFLSSAQRLYQSSISLNLTGSVTSVWVWSRDVGGVSVSWRTPIHEHTMYS